MKTHSGKSSIGISLRLAFATLLAFGLVEASNAALCSTSDVTIDSVFNSGAGDISATSCDAGTGTQDFTPDLPLDRSLWSVNLDNAGGMNDWMWYEREEEVTVANPAGHDGNTGLINLVSSTIGSGINTGTFSLNYFGGPLLFVMKTDTFDYQWYMFNEASLAGLGVPVSGLWDASTVFEGKDLSHLTVYQKHNDEVFPPVPVPAAVWLFGSGLLGLIGVARRRKSS